MMEPVVEMYPLPGERRGGRWDAFCTCGWESGAENESIVYKLVKNHVYQVHYIHWSDPVFEEAVLFL